MRKKFRTPQEKKHFSLQRDCRNLESESGSQARKNIRKAKAFGSRFFRRSQQNLGVIPKVDAGLIETLEDAVNAKSDLKRRRRWKKYSDVPLQCAIEAKTGLRHRWIMRGFWSKRRWQRVISKNLELDAPYR